VSAARQNCNTRHNCGELTRNIGGHLQHSRYVDFVHDFRKYFRGKTFRLRRKMTAAELKI